MAAPGGKGKRIADVASLAKLVSVLFAPGIVAHELGHATMCLLLRIEIREITLFELPRTAFTPGGRGGGWVDPEPIESAWKSLLVSLGPLVTSTIAALAVFAVLSRTVLAVEFATYPTSLTALARTYAAHLEHATLAETVLAVGGLWVGCTTAVTAMPSSDDALVAMDTALEATGPERALTYWPAVGLFLLSSSAIGFGLLYGLALAAAGLHGVGQVVALYPTFLTYAAIGVVLGPFERGTGFVSVTLSRFREPDRPFVEVTPVVYRRAHLLRRRAAEGESLDDAEVDHLARHLDDRYDHVRRTCARALRTVATAEPAQLTRWEETIVERWWDEPDSSTRYHLLVVLVRRAEHTADPETLRDVALEVVAADSSQVRRVGMQCTAHLAMNDPGVFSEHASELVGALTAEDVPDDEKSNLALTILKVAERVPAIFTPHRDDLEPYADSPDETVARRIGTALEAVDDALEERPEPPNERSR